MGGRGGKKQAWEPGSEAGVGQQLSDPNERVLGNKCEGFSGAILRALTNRPSSAKHSSNHGLSVLSTYYF